MDKPVYTDHHPKDSPFQIPSSFTNLTLKAKAATSLLAEAHSMRVHGTPGSHTYIHLLINASITWFI